MVVFLIIGFTNAEIMRTIVKSADVVRNFLNRSTKNYCNSTCSLSAVDGRLFSYNTCIAEFDKNGWLWINTTKYSVTTSKHQSMLKAQAWKLQPILVDSIKIETKHIVKD